MVASIVAQVTNKDITPMQNARHVPRRIPLARTAGGKAKMPAPTTALKRVPAEVMTDEPLRELSDLVLFTASSSGDV